MRNKKDIIGFVAAILVAIILWWLLRNKDKVQQVLQDAGFNLPSISLPPIPEYETPDFPTVGNNINFDGCKMCMSGNYSIIVPAGEPKIIPQSAPSPELAKALAYPRMSMTSNASSPAKAKVWWI